jgi:WD40 repeat protein
MAHQVFICHSSKDKAVADAACAALEAQHIPCWIAPRDVLGGAEYMEELDNALSDSHIVLVIFSQSANDSPQVRREIERGVSYDKILLPFRIEDTLPTRSLKFALSNTHWLNAYSHPPERHLEELTRTVLRLIERQGDPSTPTPAPQSPSKALTLPTGRTLKGHTGSVLAVTYSPDGHLLASASADKTIKLWDTVTGKQLRSIEDHTNHVRSVAFSPDGELLASGGDDRTVKLWHVPTCGHVDSFEGKGHTGAIRAVAFSRDGNTLASGGQEGTLRFWDIGTYDPAETIDCHGEPIVSITFSADESRMAIAGETGTLQVWNLDDWKNTTISDAHTAAIASIDLTPDGLTLASGSTDKTIKLWTPGGYPLGTLIAHAGPVSSVVFSPNGRHLASASDDKTIRLWDLDSIKLLRTLQVHNAPISALAYSPDGRTLASASDDKTIHLSDVSDLLP